MTKQKLYLAGPVSGLSYIDSIEWREKVKIDLEATGKYTCVSPMRGKEYLSHIADFAPVGKPNDLNYNHYVFQRDHYDVHRADVVLANLEGAKRVSIFTMMEMAWAYQNNTFVLTVMEPGNIHEHLCTYHVSSAVVSKLDDAVNYLKHVLNA